MYTATHGVIWLCYFPPLPSYLGELVEDQRLFDNINVVKRMNRWLEAIIRGVLQSGVCSWHYIWHRM